MKRDYGAAFVVLCAVALRLPNTHIFMWDVLDVTWDNDRGMQTKYSNKTEVGQRFL